MTPKKLLLLALLLTATAAWFTTTQPRANARLRAAVLGHDSDDAIRAALARGGDPYAPHMGKPLIWFVMNSSDKSSLPILLPGGLDLKKLENSGRDLFTLAADHGEAEVVKLFLEAGMSANVDIHKGNPVGAFGEDPSVLMVALRSQSEATVRLLLQHGADVNYQERSGPSIELTPLMAAAKNSERPQFLRLLLEAGADPAVKNSGGRDALFYAGKAKNSAGEKILRGWLQKKKAKGGNPTIHKGV